MRSSIILLGLATTLCSASVVWAVGQGAAPAAGAPASAGDAKAGRQTYLRVGCYQCHGTSGEGAGQFGPKLAPDPLPYAAFIHQLRAPRALMPVYTTKVLPDREAADIFAYLAAVPKARSPDDILLLRKR